MLPQRDFASSEGAIGPAIAHLHVSGMSDLPQKQMLAGPGLSWALGLALGLWLFGCHHGLGQDSNFSNFWRRVTLSHEMERTNPAMLKAQEVAWSATEQRLTSNLWSRIERVREFGMLFTNRVQQFTYSEQAEQPHLWIVQTGLYDRYILRMRVPFRVDYTWTNVVSYEEPNFVILEWLGPGNPHYIGCQRLQAEWKRFVASLGDFSSVGMILTTNRPQAHFDSFWKAYFFEFAITKGHQSRANNALHTDSATTVGSESANTGAEPVMANR